MRFLILPLGFALASGAAEIQLEVPQPADDRLQLALYASNPDIVTPIGAAVDARGRLFVVESHTHLRASSYTGPKHDRIKIFEGLRPDGRAARMSIFADDIDEAMNLAFAPDGTLLVCTAKTVFALPDRDGDGRADRRVTVVSLETKQSYPHSQLLGLTSSADGWLYVSRGNIGGYAYAWVGATGERIEGYGEGGDIVRCRADGSRLERVATGFWNPFDLRFDRQGRLLCVDNDPDSRGPNRLLHIVAGGDYGFRALYGPSGLHPYNAWDGERPGTLPMMAGVGEAPSAVLDLSFAALPAAYRDTVLVTIWGEHALTLVRPRGAGGSQRGTAEVFARGGKYFRPVALAPAPDGAVFLTDWVSKDYPNHGYGRIWRLSAKPGVKTVGPAAGAAGSVAAPAPADFPALQAALGDADPFVRHGAVMALGRPGFFEQVQGARAHADAHVRLGAWLALRRADPPAPEAMLREGLRDADPRVREVALMWTGDKVLKSLAADVAVSLALPGLRPDFFEVWLATAQILRSDAAERYASRTPGFQIKRPIDAALVEQVVTDERQPAGVRAFALARLPSVDSEALRALLLALARSGETALQIAAIARLASDTANGETLRALRALAFDRAQPAEVRAEAVLALGGRGDVALAPLLDDPEPAVRVQAARALRTDSGNAKVAALLGPGDRPETLEGWQRRLASGGDRAAGRRVFFSPVAVCSGCHRVDGRGGALGPDLSLIGRTANRAQLIQSIVQPSDDISPQFQGWEVKLTSGEVVTGLQGHLRTGGSVSILSLDGRESRIPARDVVSFGAMSGSLMPEGLHALLSVEEFRDLVAFLAAAK